MPRFAKTIVMGLLVLGLGGLREVLELTKMNVNNCSFADGTPITLSFAEKVGG